MLNNPFWLQLDGTPSAVRPPTALRVLQRPISKAQLASVQYLYGQFAAQMRLSVAPGQQWERFLLDGTRVLLRSHRGHDEVLVWPTSPDGQDPQKIGGYLVKPYSLAQYRGWGSKPDAYLPTPNRLLDPPKLKINSSLVAGKINWVGPKGQLLSWNHGGRNRYATDMWDAVFLTSLPGTYLGGASGIYYQGTKITTTQGVAAAAVFRKWLVYLAPNGELYCTPSPLEAIDRDHRKGVHKAEIVPVWTQVPVDGVEALAAGRRVSAWHFAPDGAKAGCATVLSSYGIGNWTFARACVDALPQTKRYVHLSVDVQGKLAARTDEVAFDGQAWETWAGPYLLHRDEPLLNSPSVVNATAADHPISYGGRRLWGIDFMANGAEVAITCRREGTGHWKYTPPPAPTDPNPTRSWDVLYSVDVGWGIYFNEHKVIAARNVAKGLHWHESSTVQVTEGSSTTIDHAYGEQLGDEPVQSNALSIYDMDARYGVVVAERARIEFPLGLQAEWVAGAGLPNANGMSTQTAQMHISLELVHGGQLVWQHPVPVPSELLSGYRVKIGAAADSYLSTFSSRNGIRYMRSESVVCHGPTFYTNLLGNSNWGLSLSMPQSADAFGENRYTDAVCALAVADGYAAALDARYGARSDHLRDYPNQVSDSVINSKTSRMMQLIARPYPNRWAVTIREASVWNSAQAVYATDIPALEYDYRVTRPYLGFGANFAQRSAKDAVTTMYGGYALGMLMTLERVRQHVWAITPLDIRPANIGLGLQLANANDPLNIIDLKPAVAARLQMAGIEILAEDLFLDPVRAV